MTDQDGLSATRRLMAQFDDLPLEVREALSSANSPSDQMLEVLCIMHQSGFALADLLRVVAASNAKGSE